METITYHGQTLTRWRVGQSSFLAWPEKGARLLNWNLTHADGSVRDVIYWPENADFADFAKVRGGNPILFPFNGRTFDHGDIFFWRDPAGVRRPMPMHGIARQGDFEVLRKDARGFAARFLPGAEAKEAYPFTYDLVVTYRFEATSLTCELALTNHGQEPMPWSAGHHFYFTLPWAEGTKRSDYLIRIPAGRRMRQDAKGMLVPGPELKPEESLANNALIDTHHTDMTSSEIVFGEKGRPGDVTVRNGTSKLPTPESQFVTWTADDQAPYYCVEPWMGPPNPLENKRGVHWVQPGNTETFSVSVAVK